TAAMFMETSSMPTVSPSANSTSPSCNGEEVRPRTGSTTNPATAPSTMTAREPNAAQSRPAMGAATMSPTLTPKSDSPRPAGVAPTCAASAGTRAAHEPNTTPLSTNTMNTAVLLASIRTPFDWNVTVLKRFSRVQCAKSPLRANYALPVDTEQS